MGWSGIDCEGEGRGGEERVGWRVGVKEGREEREMEEGGRTYCY